MRREQLNLSRAKLAEQIDVPVKSIAKWEIKGVPVDADARVIARWERGLNVAKGWLLGDTGRDVGAVVDRSNPAREAAPAVVSIQGSGASRDDKPTPQEKATSVDVAQTADSKEDAGVERARSLAAGYRARVRREALGIPRAQLAKDVGVSLTSICRWERSGVPHDLEPATIRRWANELQVAAGWLRDGDTAPDGAPALRERSTPATVVPTLALTEWSGTGHVRAIASGGRARARREELGIRRSRLAKAIGAAPTNISRWERHGIPAYLESSTIQRWEEELHVAQGWLRDGGAPVSGDQTGNREIPDQNVIAGKKARERRESLGLSRSFMTLQIGVSHHTLTIWESRGLPAKLPLAIEKRWERALAVEAGWLTGKISPISSRTPIELHQETTIRGAIEAVARWLANPPAPDDAKKDGRSGKPGAAARRAGILAQRYGVDADTGTNLEAIARRNSITVSRVSQIISALIELSDTCEIVAPVFQRMEEAARPHLPCAEDHLQDVLLPLLGGRLALDGVIRFANEILRRPFFGLLREQTEAGAEVTIYDPEAGNVLGIVNQRELATKRLAQAMIRASGAGHLGLLMSFATAQGWETTHVQSMRANLSGQTGFEWLDKPGIDEPQWFWFKDDNPSRSPVIKTLRRVFSVASGPVGFESLLGAIDRVRAMRARSQELSPMLGVNPPVHVIRALLQRIDWLVLANTEEYRSTLPLDPEKELPAMEFLLYEELKRIGGATSRGTLMRTLTVGDGNSEMTVNSLLSNSPIVTRFCQGVYLLRGHTPTAAAFLRAMETAHRVDPLLDGE